MPCWPVVEIFTANHFEGRSARLYPGEYDLNAIGLPNDSIRSVRVPARWKVTLFEHASFKGSSTVLRRDDPDLGAFAARASSVRVEGRRVPAIFSGPQFAGKRQDLLDGDYDKRAIELGNDAVESVSVPEGWEVILFKDAGWKGPSVQLKADTPTLGWGSGEASSVRVRQPPGVEIFNEVDRKGTAFRLDAGRYDLDDLPGNDVIRSVHVESGFRILAFADAGFSGASTVIRDDRNTLGEWDKRISSMIVYGRPESLPLPTLYNEPWYTGNGGGFQSGRHDLAAGVSPMRNDSPRSILVPPGWRVRAYEHGGFTGAYRDFRSNTPELGDWDRRISSLRACSPGQSPPQIDYSIVVKLDRLVLGTFDGRDGTAWDVTIDLVDAENVTLSTIYAHIGFNVQTSYELNGSGGIGRIPWEGRLGLKVRIVMLNAVPLSPGVVHPITTYVYDHTTLWGNGPQTRGFINGMGKSGTLEFNITATPLE